MFGIQDLFLVERDPSLLRNTTQLLKDIIEPVEDSDAVVEVLKAVESGEFDVGVDNLDRVASIVRASA